jgi:predicted nucleic acid-binding protein
MKYVIDTSIEVKRFVPEADSPKALQLRDDARKGIHDLLAPDLFPIEVCNALMILERAGKILPGEANLLFARFLREVPNSFARAFMTACTSPLPNGSHASS